MKGDWKTAKGIYEEWKGSTFYDILQDCNDFFLDDINKLEQTGIDIDRKNFEKVRQLLSE